MNVLTKIISTFLIAGFVGSALAEQVETKQQEQVKFRISAILVRTEAEAQVVLSKLKAGVDFAELARKYSIGPGKEKGGDLGYFASGDLMEELRLAASSLPVGQYSRVIKTTRGCFILMKTDERSPSESEPRKETEAQWNALMQQLFEHYKQGNYVKAISKAREALQVAEATFSPNDPNIVTSLHNLAGLYCEWGKYSETEPLYRRALAIQEEAMGLEHPDVAKVLNDLASLYHTQGKYAEAEPLLRRALVIHEKKLGQEHPDVATSLHNLASLYGDLGKYAEAEPLHRRALAIMEKFWGPEHFDVATSLNNLARLYVDLGKYADAEPLHRRALAIREKFMGPEHQDVAVCLNDLAGLYYAQGKYSEVEVLLKRALATWEKALGPEHSYVATSLNNLALLYQAQGKYAEAEPLHQRSLAIREKSLGPEHPNIATSLNNLAVLLVAADRPRQALPLMTRSLAIDEHTMDNVFSIASEREKFAFLSTISHRFELLLSLAGQELPEDVAATSAGLDVVLRRKGLVLEALSLERQALATSTDPQVAQIAQELQEVSSRLATLTLAGPGEKSPSLYRQNLAQLEAEKERLEDELTRLSGAYAAERQSRKADCQSVAQALPAGSALVEFVSFQSFNFKEKNSAKKWGEYRYLSFVLPAGATAKPVLVNLGSAEDIDRAVREFRTEVQRAPQDIPSLGELAVEQRLSEKSRILYELAFAPLKNALGNTQVLFLSPDGDLNLVPFAALQDGNGRYLAEDYQLNYLSSGRDLLRYRQPAGEATKTVIVADPDYNLTGEERLSEAQSLLSRGMQLASRGTPCSTDLRAIIWEPLPGSRKEAEEVTRLLGGKTQQLYLGKEALEEVFKRVQSPQRLHLATHGFFLEEQDKSEWLAAAEQTRGIVGITTRPSLGEIKIENPLLRSGLVLAGANRLGKEELPEGAEDGILTALEISGIPLWGTDLVVLSACETGVGETRRGEGVFGLRRAFQLAGARTVVMSLWDVPDVETQQLMTDFYRRMKGGTGKSKALQEASLALMKQRREQTGAAHPYFWAAFVCVGEP